MNLMKYAPTLNSRDEDGIVSLKDFSLMEEAQAEKGETQKVSLTHLLQVKADHTNVAKR